MATRRGNDEGTIYCTRDGRWRAQASSAGKRVGVSRRTRAAAVSGLRHLLDAGAAMPPSATPPTLDDLLARWLEEVVRPTLRPRTHRLYSDIARLHLIPLLGALPLPDLQPEHVRQLDAALLARGLAPKTVRIVYGVLHGALHQAVGWQLVPRNVARMVRPPRVLRKEIAPSSTSPRFGNCLRRRQGGAGLRCSRSRWRPACGRESSSACAGGMSTSTPGSCGCSGN